MVQHFCLSTLVHSLICSCCTSTPPSDSLPACLPLHVNDVSHASLQPPFQEEAAALEAANVRAILECGPMVEGVLSQLRHTQTVLDDLDESLKVTVM